GWPRGTSGPPSAAPPAGLPLEDEGRRGRPDGTVGVDVRKAALGLGRGALLGEGHLAVQLTVDHRRDRVQVALHGGPALDEVARVAVDRVPALPFLEELARHVLHVVVLGVAAHAHGVGLDQGRALAVAGAGDGPARDLVHRKDVVAGHLFAEAAVGAALSTKRGLAVCRAVGVEYAYLLFSTIRTRGTFRTQARFSPSWKAPVEVPPSPIQLSAPVGRPFMRSAIRAPVRIEIMSPSIEISEGMLPSSLSQP